LDSETFLTTLELTEVAQKRQGLRDESIVSYAVLPAGLAIWVYDNRSVEYRWLPLDTSDLKSTAKRFVELCSNPDSDLLDLQSYAKKLYQVLIFSIERPASTERVLVIEADAPISQVPMQALIEINVLANIYGHVFGDSQRRAVDKLAHVFMRS